MRTVLAGVTLLAACIVGAFVYFLSGCGQPAVLEDRNGEPLDLGAPETAVPEREDPDAYVMGRSADAVEVCECTCVPGFRVETTCLMTMDGRRSSVRYKRINDVRPPDGLKLYPEDTCPAFDYGFEASDAPVTKLPALWWDHRPDGTLIEPHRYRENACTCTCPKATETAWPCVAEKIR